MNEANKNVPAFPIEAYSRNGDAYPGDGMTLRDYFAAKAMAAYLASSSTPRPTDQASYALAAYEMADAMLDARSK